MDRKALIVITSNDKIGDTGKLTGWYLSEVSQVYYPLLQAGFLVDFASPKGGAAPMDESSRKPYETANKKFLEDSAVMNKVKNTIPASDIDPKRYQAVYFAGGRGAMWDFPDNADLQRIASTVYENGGIVAAVCHGPAALVNVKLSNGKHLVEGKDVNCFTNAEEDESGYSDLVPFLLESKLRERGARFQYADNWKEKVVISDRLITGQNPASAAAVGEKLVEFLRGAEKRAVA